VKRILDRKPLAPDGPRDPFKGATITWWRFNISRDAASNGFHFMPLQFTLPFVDIQQSYSTMGEAKTHHFHVLAST